MLKFADRLLCDNRRIQSSPDVSSFFQAVQEGNTEKVKRSWLSGMEVNVTDELGRTSLHVAVENGQLGVIELLLSAGVNTNVVDSEGRSPISIALEKQQFAIAEMLRAHQKKKLVSRQVKSSEDEHNIALAFRATKRGDMEKLKQLVPELVRPIWRTTIYALCCMLQVRRDICRSPSIWGLRSERQLAGSMGIVAVIGRGDFAHNELAKFLIANHAPRADSVPRLLSTTLTMRRWQERWSLRFELLQDSLLFVCCFFTDACTQDSWLMGQVHCPVLDDDKLLLVTHSIWQKNNSAVQRQHKTGGYCRLERPRTSLSTLQHCGAMPFRSIAKCRL
ncbi:Ankyrin repeat-containing domain [Phytophthora cactorum]|nr:Ankyrin repeat-containing domain [Phytophthora cactorum]